MSRRFSSARRDAREAPDRALREELRVLRGVYWAAFIMGRPMSIKRDMKGKTSEMEAISNCND